MGGSYVALAAQRILDTRTGVGAPAARLAAGQTLTLQVGGRGDVPLNGAAAVALNVTIAAPTAGGYVTVWPSDQPQPATSDLNFTSGQTAANLVVVTMSSDGTVTLFNGSAGSTDLIADVEGTTSAGRLSPLAASPR